MLDKLNGFLGDRVINKLTTYDAELYWLLKLPKFCSHIAISSLEIYQIAIICHHFKYVHGIQFLIMTNLMLMSGLSSLYVATDVLHFYLLEIKSIIRQEIFNLGGCYRKCDQIMVIWQNSKQSSKVLRGSATPDTPFIRRVWQSIFIRMIVI